MSGRRSSLHNLQFTSAAFLEKTKSSCDAMQKLQTSRSMSERLNESDEDESQDEEKEETPKNTKNRFPAMVGNIKAKVRRPSLMCQHTDPDQSKHQFSLNRSKSTEGLSEKSHKKRNFKKYLQPKDKSDHVKPHFISGSDDDDDGEIVPLCPPPSPMTPSKEIESKPYQKQNTLLVPDADGPFQSDNTTNKHRRPSLGSTASVISKATKQLISRPNRAKSMESLSQSKPSKSKRHFRKNSKSTSKDGLNRPQFLDEAGDGAHKGEDSSEESNPGSPEEHCEDDKQQTEPIFPLLKVSIRKS